MHLNEGEFEVSSINTLKKYFHGHWVLEEFWKKKNFLLKTSES